MKWKSEIIFDDILVLKMRYIRNSKTELHEQTKQNKQTKDDVIKRIQIQYLKKLEKIYGMNK